MGENFMMTMERRRLHIYVQYVQYIRHDFINSCSFFIDSLDDDNSFTLLFDIYLHPP